MKANNESTSTESVSSIVSFQRDDIMRLIRGDLPIKMAMDYLRNTTEEDIDPAGLALFIDVISETVEEESAILGHINGAMDCCGTGGSGLPHFNTSTTVAFILAAAGVPTTKFGNRAAISMSGSFDLLGNLGIGTEVPIKEMMHLFEETNLLFLFAPQFYPALATIAPVRQVLGSRTVFNLIGPLLNPVHPRFRLMGTPQLKAHELIANYLRTEGHVSQACVVTSSTGLDELEVGETNLLTFITGPEKRVEELYFGSQVADKPWGSVSAAECVRIFYALMRNEMDVDGYFYRTVCLNAGVGLSVAGKAEDIDTGYELAAELLKSGKVAEKFEQYRSAHARYSR